MEKLKNYYRALVVFISHFLIYRICIFNGTDKEFTSDVFIRKFITGFLYDMQFLFLILFVMGLINLVIKNKWFFNISFIFIFLITALLNLVNFYMLGYFSDGLASLGILVEYLADIDTVLKMGVGTFKPWPPVFLFLPIILFFIPLPKLKFSWFEYKPLKRFLVLTFILNIVFNQVVKPIRVNRGGALESNTVIRILKSESNTAAIFAEVKKLKGMKLGESDLALIQNNPYAEYVSSDYPLMKKDNLPELPNKLNKPNIILFVFESVGAFQTGITEYFTDAEKTIFKNQKSMTPYFDSLLKKSHVYPNFYAHGTYTSLGQVSMLCSVYDPVSALDGQGSIMRNYYGTNLKCLPNYLKELGYKTMFFNGYRKGFDNKAMFFPKIGIDEIYCRERLKAEMNIKEDEHTWGLEDSTVARHMTKTLAETQTPFFTTFMSVNTHAPYNHIKKLPSGHSKHDYSLLKVDKALEQFMEESKKQEWFKNSVFIFAADNGAPLRLLADTKGINEDLYYNRIPFAVYIPGQEVQVINPKVSSQIDVTPSILHLMGENKTSNHFVGQSIFTESASYPLQYKHYNNFFTVPDIGIDKIDRLRKIHMSFIFGNGVVGDE